jgi:hypothetical protein
MPGYRARPGRFLAEWPPQVSWLMTGVEGSTVGAVNKLVACDSSIKAFIDGPHFVWVKICQNDFDPKNSIVYIIG